MTALRRAVTEIWGLFVDDSGTAGLMAVLIVVVGLLVKVVGLPPLWGGAMLLLGALAILAWSVDRGARRR